MSNPATKPMSEPIWPRKCHRKDVHGRHMYNYIPHRSGRNIAFGQWFECPGRKS